MRRVHVRAWVGAVAVLVASCGGGGGIVQFVAKAPTGSMYGEFSKTVERGAKAMGCKVEKREPETGARSFSVSCSQPEYRYVGIVEKTVDEFTWSCNVSESACRAFVDELVAAAK